MLTALAETPGPRAWKSACRQCFKSPQSGRRAAYLSNGFRVERTLSRTGTAPKPSSLRMPLTR